MKQFKKAKVILTPTKNISNLFTDKIGGRLYQYKDEDISRVLDKHQQLHFVSDDEIKKGEYILIPFTDGETFFDFTKAVPVIAENDYAPNKYVWKIIASYPSLYINIADSKDYNSGDYIGQLPQPSQQFIEQYIESYNKGEVITDVLVEMNEPVCKCNTTEQINKCYYANGENCTRKCVNGDFYGLKIKINKDNTINIKSVKNTWNREEIIENMWRAYKQADTIHVEEEGLRREFDRWIEKTL